MLTSNLLIFNRVLTDMDMNKFFLFLFSFFLFFCQNPDISHPIEPEFKNATYGAVVSPHPLATAVGMEILEIGGNAFDAAIAVHMSLAVVYPRAGNIGGGGFMVYHTGSGESGSLDFREKASHLASRDMYLNDEGNPVKDISRKGGLSVGVPGSVAGMFAIHQKFSTLTWNELIEPAIAQAKNGFVLTEREASTLAWYQPDLAHYNDAGFYLLNESWKKGDTVFAPNLAATLSLISKNGKDGFYSGEVAHKIVKTMAENNGLIDHQDLESYEAIWRDVIEFNFDEYQVLSMAPPSSGGIALAQLFYGFEQFNGDTMALNSANYLHLNTELQRRVYADRAEFLGDADFVEVPIDKLLSEEYLQNRFTNIDMNKATPSAEIKNGSVEMIESFETTHLNIIDRWGNAVSISTTLNGNFGSKLACADAGFLLNNEMDDFSIKPGVPNQFGLVGNEANSIAANKRMLSSMSPTIVLKEGEAVLLVGTPGGSTIITTVYQTIINSLIYGLPAQEAVNATKFHSQWFPDQLYYEEDKVDSLTLEDLRQKGHKLFPVGKLGKMKLITVKDGFVEAAGDTAEGDFAEVR